MPHFQADYPANLEARLDAAGLCRAIRAAAVETGPFPAAGIRVRATACIHCAMAAATQEPAFRDISVRLRAGRALEGRKRATARFLAVAEAFRADVMASSPFMLPLETRDIDPELSARASSIRDYLPEEAA